MYQQQMILHGNLGDTAINWAANSQALFTQIVIDSRRRPPGMRLHFNIILSFKIFTEQTPFALIPATLQQFQLLKPGKNNILFTNRVIKTLGILPGFISKDMNPD